MVKEDLGELLFKASSFHKCYNSQNAILKDAVEDLRNVSKFRFECWLDA